MMRSGRGHRSRMNWATAAKQLSKKLNQQDIERYRALFRALDTSNEWVPQRSGGGASGGGCLCCETPRNLRLSMQQNAPCVSPRPPRTTSAAAGKFR